ncbi:MAG TPA: metallopeptidase TldD-related protein [Candidatus Hydrothermia bacterium]|nr:TldD/PmbA family protein [Candidatus Hydrothermae bacterium]MDD3649815.1 metallopeptidase TldD-related protein [Candidatus Hydrothermia bacterium]MDD5572460.1 metallopeptidase TldD-related protein [Candidatus Hydrothermia bacterium]HOK23397.1 metallopeptidase TldD-related protein [Candidatus Hydrothermia bacterium]HOL24207.1 metallopeptidase TldD-related protein [Candidatus Hydrothermia bacterium]
MARYIDSEKYFDIAREVLNASSGGFIEVAILHTLEDNARFTESTIHQYTNVNRLQISVRVRFGDKCGLSLTTDATKEGLIALVKRAEELALNSEEDPYLPIPEAKKNLFFEQVDPAVARLGPEEKTRFLGKIFREFSGDFTFYGIMRSSLNFVGIYNNLDLNAGLSFSTLHLALLPEDVVDKDTFWVQYSGPSLDSVKYDDIFTKLRGFLKMRYAGVHFKPGRYTVILSPYAVKEVLDLMQFVGFSAGALEQGSSFLAGMEGRRVFGSEFTLIDKPLRDPHFSMPFDFEGIPKRKLTIFENGIFKRFIFDKRTAKIFNKKSTGHSLEPMSSYPFAGHLGMPGGDKSLEELIQESHDVIYVSRFHYVNVLDPKTFTLTGMTRDGTFRIRNRKWVRLPSLRFHVNFIDLFNNITGVSKEVEEVGFLNSYGMDLPASYQLPYLRCDGFNFIGFSTEEE